MSNVIVFYNSTDASAPVLSGTAGSLIALLDAVLVNGYGSKASLGWAKTYSGTNKAVYRSANIASNRFYLRVDETGVSAGGQKEAQVRGYETMSDVDTGTGPFPLPTDATFPIVVWSKSNTADATARAWLIFGNDKTFYIRIANGVASYMGAFGHSNPLRPGDGFNTFLAFHVVNGIGTTQRLLGNIQPMVNVPAPASQVVAPRAFTQIGGAIHQAPQMYGGGFMHNTTGGGTYDHVFGRGSPGNAASHDGQSIVYWPTYPSPINQSLWVCPVGVVELVNSGTANDYRAILPGLYQALTSTSLCLNDFDTVVATQYVAGNLIGIQFTSFSVSSMVPGLFLVDQSGPW
jgi:hypothetical protein